MIAHRGLIRGERNKSNNISLFRQLSSFVIVTGFLLLIITASTKTTTTANAFMLKSTGTGGWATGFDYFADDQSYIISGTLYANNFWDDLATTIGGEEDKFQCFVVQVAHDETTNNASVMKATSKAFDDPQICVGGAQLIDHRNSGFAAIMGTSGQAATIQMLTQSGGIGRPIEPSTKFDLPAESIPVASTYSAAAAENSFNQHLLYVAIHTTGGWSINRETTSTTSNPNGDNLKGLSELYWLPLTDPPVTENGFVSIHMFDTGKISEVMTHDMTISSGNAVVAALSSTPIGIGGSLLVAGSSNGSGNEFGSNPANDNNNTPGTSATTNANLWDGYVTWLNAETLSLQHSMRLNVDPNLDDNVRDICVFGPNLYVVGTSWEPGVVPGIKQPKGFVMKIDLHDRELRWTLKNLDGQAMKCVADQMNVYVATHVEQHHGIQGANRSKAQNVIISKIHSGPLHHEVWNERIDTTKSVLTDIRNDYIVGLELGPTGNPVALINSINYEQGLNDIILLEFLKDTGRNDWNHKGIKDKQNPTHHDDKQTSTTTSPPPVQQDINEQQKKIVIYMAILIPILFCLWVVFYHFACNNSNRSHIEKEADSGALIDGPSVTIDDDVVNDLSLEEENNQEQSERQIV